MTVGSSTHNERIERLWRDVRTSVLKPFAEAFRALESEDNLDPPAITLLAKLLIQWEGQCSQTPGSPKPSPVVIRMYWHIPLTHSRATAG